jgi:predicted DNA-binding transcriptional regulator YafY
MPVNRNAYRRYLTYDKCFQKTNRSYTVKELMRESQPPVSRAMLYNDLAFMKSDEGFGAPIVSRLINGVAHYTYADPGFSIVKQPIRDSEKETLLETLALLSRSGGLPGFEWVGETLLRFEESLATPVQTGPVMIFQSNPYLTNIGLLGDLYRHILHKKVLNIRYKPFAEKQRKILFHPYVLKQYNQRWYYFGWYEPGQQIYNLAVDRIVSLKETDRPFIENRNIDFDDFFDDVVGVTVSEDREKQEVTLEVHPVQLPYLLTKPIHHSQVNRKKPGRDGWYTVTLKLIPNYELESILLSFAPNVRVVKPGWLRESIRRKLSQALDNHKVQYPLRLGTTSDS